MTRYGLFQSDANAVLIKLGSAAAAFSLSSRWRHRLQFEVLNVVPVPADMLLRTDYRRRSEAVD